jgi:hypothetical protein
MYYLVLKHLYLCVTKGKYNTYQLQKNKIFKKLIKVKS